MRCGEMLYGVTIEEANGPMASCSVERQQGVSSAVCCFVCARLSVRFGLGIVHAMSIVRIHRFVRVYITRA